VLVDPVSQTFSLPNVKPGTLLTFNFINHIGPVLHDMNWVVNMTDLEVPHGVINFLSLGHNFNLEPCNIKQDTLHIIKDVEYALNIAKKNNVSDSLVNSIRNLAINQISNFQNKHKKQKKW